MTQIISLLAVFAALTGFSLTGIESLSAAISSPEGEDGLYELFFHFPDQAAEPAILNKDDDTGLSFFRFANLKFYELFGTPGTGSASSFSRLQFHSTGNSFDNTNTIQIKLRI